MYFLVAYLGQGPGGRRVCSSPDVLFDFLYLWQSLNSSRQRPTSSFRYTCRCLATHGQLLLNWPWNRKRFARGNVMWMEGNAYDAKMVCEVKGTIGNRLLQLSPLIIQLEWQFWCPRDQIQHNSIHLNSVMWQLSAHPWVHNKYTLLTPKSVYF